MKIMLLALKHAISIQNSLYAGYSSHRMWLSVSSCELYGFVKGISYPLATERDVSGGTPLGYSMG